MSTTTLSWLHISDLHLREGIAWAQDVVLASMLEDISTRYRSDRPDLVFLTGDLAFSGKPAEYDLADEFISRLLAAVQLPRDRLFLVPGNHDIDRDVEEDAYNGVRSGLTTATEADAFFAKESRRRSLFRRQAAYRAFANRVTESILLTDTSYSHYRDLAIGPLRVRVLLLDSAWLAGGDDDMGQLLVGERQILDMSRSTADRDSHLTFALMHHPFAWLREWEALTIENAVIDHADICLRGHVHVADQRATEAIHGRIGIFTAGAAFETRTTDNTYNSCSLDLLSGGGKVVAHRFIAHEKRWEAREPRAWTLVSKPSSLPLGDALGMTTGSCRFPHYAACLVSGITLDVPITIGANECFVSASASIPGIANSVGESVARLWFHCHWRDIWETTQWMESARRLLCALDVELSRFDNLAGELAQREVHCKAIAEALMPNRPRPLAELQDEIHILLAEHDAAAARRVLQRWANATFTSSAERAQLLRLEVELLIVEQRRPEALAAAQSLSATTGDAEDFALAAACAQACGNSAAAATLMHRAIDLGAPVQKYATLALAVAGSAGDAALVKKVRP